MSTNSECRFYETTPGTWYYLLEDYDAPKNAFDWRQYASCYGPFSTQEAAFQHLSDNHANPGGFCVQTYQDGYKPDETMQRLITEATAPTSRRQTFGYGVPGFRYYR